nr:hypothetical protein CFP56_52946 [Quercus suber]
MIICDHVDVALGLKWRELGLTCESLSQLDSPRKKQLVAGEHEITDASESTLRPLIPVPNQHPVTYIDGITSAAASDQTLPPLDTIPDSVSVYGHDGRMIRYSILNFMIKISALDQIFKAVDKAFDV